MKIVKKLTHKINHAAYHSCIGSSPGGPKVKPVSHLCVMCVMCDLVYSILCLQHLFTSPLSFQLKPTFYPSPRMAFDFNKCGKRRGPGRKTRELQDEDEEAEKTPKKRKPIPPDTPEKLSPDIVSDSQSHSESACSESHEEQEEEVEDSEGQEEEDAEDSDSEEEAKKKKKKKKKKMKKEKKKEKMKKKYWYQGRDKMKSFSSQAEKNAVLRAHHEKHFEEWKMEESQLCHIIETTREVAGVTIVQWGCKICMAYVFI